MSRLVTIRNRVSDGIRGSKVGLGLGLVASTLAGAPMPLPQLALAGPVVATLAAGAIGGRAAAAVGFVSYLAFSGPSPAAALAAGVISALVGWAVPMFLGRAHLSEEEGKAASAIVVECDGFASLDDVYGDGTSGHVFGLLHRALKTETRESDLVVHAEGRELIIVIDGSTPEVVQAVMGRVERRFSGWLADAGYDCNLSVGLATGEEGHADGEDALRAPRGRSSRPYLD